MARSVPIEVGKTFPRAPACGQDRKRRVIVSGMRAPASRARLQNVGPGLNLQARRSTVRVSRAGCRNGCDKDANKSSALNNFGQTWRGQPLTETQLPKKHHLLWNILFSEACMFGERVGFVLDVEQRIGAEMGFCKQVQAPHNPCVVLLCSRYKGQAQQQQ